jgi:16S rRNA (cytosine1402-N4)-methyltransferase
MDFRRHIPVLAKEILQVFSTCSPSLFLDGTVGAGGHAALLLDHYPQLHLLGLDQDEEACSIARENLAGFGNRVRIEQANFRHISHHCDALGIQKVDGLLLDLGVSSMQLEWAHRGFSFMREGPLDMRMNPREGQSAAELIDECSEQELAAILHRYGEVSSSRRVARELIARRPFRTTGELARTLSAILPRRGLHPATQVFQALRIAVNDELAALAEGLEQAVNLLRPGGRLAIISFHSLEDRIVKQFFAEADRGWTSDPTDLYSGRRPCGRRVRLLSRRAIQPSSAERQANPRSRSARLRVVEAL